jgi:hypothetical protein
MAKSTAWQDAGVAGKFLDERRAAIPYHEDQLTMMLHLSWLREIGSSHVDCYFKWLELTVMAGVKPAA